MGQYHKVLTFMLSQSQQEKGRSREQKTTKETVAENFPNLVKDILSNVKVSKSEHKFKGICTGQITN